METADDIQIKIHSQMSPAEKWAEVLRLRNFAWAIKKAFIKQQHPDWTEEQIESEVRKIFTYAST